MRNRIGTTCMILGTVLVLAALSLFLWNQRENQQAGTYVEEILPQVIKQIEAPTSTAAPQEEPSLPDPYDPAMREVEIDGYAYIGYLSIPAIEAELPVMSEWDYTRLKIAPCRYAGSTKTDDLVICAHNYSEHFGSIQNLALGDQVCFTDMDGITHLYAVASVETMAPTAVEEATCGDYALVLLTCTYGGRTRVAVGCDRIETEENH